jgi:hypothetical protein
MNKILIAITTFLSTIMFANAQTEKGTQTAGLTLQYSTSQNSDFNINTVSNLSSTAQAKTTLFNLGPQYSYFIADQLDLAFNISYSSTVTNLQNSDPSIIEQTKQSSKDVNVRVAIRKYLLHQNKLGIRVGAYVGYGSSKGAIIYPSPNESYYNTTNYPSAGLGLELIYYPSKKVGLSANLVTLQYQHYKENGGADGSNSGSSFDLNLVNQGLGISVFYVFGGKG